MAKRVTRLRAGAIAPPPLRLRQSLADISVTPEPRRSLALQDWLIANFRLPAEVLRNTRRQWSVRFQPAGLEACEWAWGAGGQVSIIERSMSRRIIWMGTLPVGADNLIAALHRLVSVYRHD